MGSVPSEKLQVAGNLALDPSGLRYPQPATEKKRALPDLPRGNILGQKGL